MRISITEVLEKSAGYAWCTMSFYTAYSGLQRKFQNSEPNLLTNPIGHGNLLEVSIGSEPMQNIKFRIKSACRIAQIEHQRFNEAVAAGHYPCAPEVARGSTRLFSYSDLIALFFYGRLLEQGWPPRIAGQYACRILDALKRSPEEKAVMVIYTTANGFTSLAESQLSEPPRVGTGSALVLQRFSFDIENARQIIDREIDEETSIVGEDE